MFDILVYLFEHYVRADACPDTDHLARKLSAAGFEDEDISEALSWLDELRADTFTGAVIQAPGPLSTRVFIPDETARLDAECRGFIAFLESAGVLDPLLRELIIERALAIDDLAINLDRLKVIVLMVMWQHDHAIDTLILDELLTERDDNDEDDEADNLAAIH